MATNDWDDVPVPATEKTNSLAASGLDLLRKPFPAHQISKLPKPTKKQSDEVKANFKAGIRCQICGTWHHPEAIHLDYVGHAALTDRLLDADPAWYWEPLSLSPEGIPVRDKDGGMWIKLTVCGVTRLGYGHAGDKTGGDAIKEIIGDALRNAAMRFGAALDLWHKGDLHIEEEPKQDESPAKNYPASGAGVKEEAYDTLDDDGRAWIDALAQEIHAMYTDNSAPDDLIRHIKAALGDSDQQWKLALWWKLPSHVRTFIDKQEKGIKRKAELTQPEQAAA